MNALCNWWRHLLGRDKEASVKFVTGTLFCTECANAVGGRCVIKNRTVRECSSACSGFMIGGAE